MWARFARSSIAMAAAWSCARRSATALSSSSSFVGTALRSEPRGATATTSGGGGGAGGASWLVMRKQKASDRRARRARRDSSDATTVVPAIVAVPESSPMAAASWKHKTVVKRHRNNGFPDPAATTGGRGRSRKRSSLYETLSSYSADFLNLLTEEYRAEEREVLGRIEASTNDPLALEASGHALFDLCPERRGNIYSDEVYRLSKSADAATPFPSAENGGRHRFAPNDVIVLTSQPNGVGDFFGASSTPTHPDATTAEARVLSVGPTHVDVAVSGGAFEGAFGPAPNDRDRPGDPRTRLRADRFLSAVPYARMVSAVSRTTAPPANRRADDDDDDVPRGARMDGLLNDLVVATYASSSAAGDGERIAELARLAAKPPRADSRESADEVVEYVRTNPDGRFARELNGPQLSAVRAALTRRLTMIQGPPGTGKTTVAAAIGFGFVHQCRDDEKVLACAFSNVGADNLADALSRLGLKVVRVGRASATAERWRDRTLDAAVDRDPEARAARAAADAAVAAARPRGDARADRSAKETAAAATRTSIRASRIAATKALRDADVVVSTSIGAADPRLLAACGVPVGNDDDDVDDHRSTRAPDGGPPLRLPFVIVDEACQSVEPATLVPITSTDSCRAVVLLGDPCQLPPTVKGDEGSSSPLAVSLMARLASVLPHPVVFSAPSLSKTERDEYFLNFRPTHEASSLVRYRRGDQESRRSYRKRFAGALLLSVQYRMHPSIAAFSSAVFYDGLLSTPYFLGAYRPLPKALSSVLPSSSSSSSRDGDRRRRDVNVRFVDVGGGNNERRGVRRNDGATSPPFDDDDASYRNENEALRVVELLRDLLARELDDATTPATETIGVVTPYAAQVDLLRTTMAADARLRDLVRAHPSEIEVSSVDAFQGRERDLILFSAVRSNRSGRVGFLRDWRRMNVALTRARSAVVVVGDMTTLRHGDVHWEAFCEWCESAGCVVRTNDTDHD